MSLAGATFAPRSLEAPGRCRQLLLAPQCGFCQPGWQWSPGKTCAGEQFLGLAEHSLELATKQPRGAAVKLLPIAFIMQMKEEVPSKLSLWHS